MRTKAFKFIVAALFSVAIFLTQSGCNGVAPGHDPILVRAEQTTQIALETFDSFLKWEYDNRQALSKTPEIKKLADGIRASGISWLKSAREMTEAYRLNRTPEAKADLETALAVLSSALNEAKVYLRAKNRAALAPPCGALQLA